MSYGEELTTHTSPESCVKFGNNFSEALTMERAGHGVKPPLLTKHELARSNKVYLAFIEQ